MNYGAIWWLGELIGVTISFLLFKVFSGLIVVLIYLLELILCLLRTVWAELSEIS